MASEAQNTSQERQNAQASGHNDPNNRQPQPSGYSAASENSATSTITNISQSTTSSTLPVAPSSGIRIGHYILTKTLGTGTFGKVKLAHHQITGHKVAVKILNRRKIKSLDVVSKIRREIQNLKLVRHPHIIKLYQVISSATEFYMVMEYVPGGELFEYIVKKGKLDEIEAKKIFQQLVSGIDYCHRHNVVHRDLKPENLLLDHNKNVRIADFGLSNMMSDGEFLRTSCGSPNYAAPEVISGKLYAGPEIDIWSCGVILYALVCGVLPFDDESVPNLFRKIRSGKYYEPEHVSQGCRELIARMLEVDQVKRITIEEIKRHAWFKQDLPKYLFPDELIAQRREIIDMEIVQQVATKFSVSCKKVVEAVHAQQEKLKTANLNKNMSSNTLGTFTTANDHKNNLYTAYCMILDSRILYEHAPEFYHANEQDGFANPSHVKNVKLLNEQENAATQNKREQALHRAQNMIHPERIMKVLDYGPTDAAIQQMNDLPVTKPRSRALKWHLGIRSSSPPYDIMYEVYKAMKKLDFYWKMITPYYLVVRRQIPNGNTKKFAFMTSQLYQVDFKNYLLDFANKFDHEESLRREDSAEKSMQQNNNTSSQQNNNQFNSNEPEEMSRETFSKIIGDKDPEYRSPEKKQGLVITKDGEAIYPKQHIMMEFFEMCAILIKCLAGES